MTDRSADAAMVSVVMPVFDGAATLEEQLAALAAQEFEGPWELVIADNGSRDRSTEIASAWSGRLPCLRIVDASARRGCAAADNIGASEARGSILLFCDQDDLVRPGWLAAMAEALHHHDLVVGMNDFEVATAAPSTRGTSALPPSAIPTVANGARDFYGFLPWGLSCNLGCTRDAFEAVGGFDEQMKGADDIDLCWRIQLAGYVFRYQADAVVWKRRRATGRSIWDQHFNYGLYDVVLFQKFRRQGMPRRLDRGVRRWAWLLLHLPDLRSRPARHSWIRVAAAQTGRLVGSWRQRTLYL